MVIEEEILAYLTDPDGVGFSDVYTEVPQMPPVEYFIIERTSGDSTNFVRSATIAIQCISAISMQNAAYMCEYIILAMEQIPNNVQDIFSCRLVSNYNSTDTDTKQYRYQAVFELTYQNTF